VLPEAFLGGYPKGLDFGVTVGSRSPEGRDVFRRYREAAVQLSGPEIARLADLAAELDVHLVAGVIERDGGTLYCTAVFIDPRHGLVAHHRKLMPTAAERLLWGQGDGSTMPAVRTGLRCARCGDLLGELHAALPAGHVREGCRDLVRSDGGRPRPVAGDHAGTSPSRAAAS
jgi:predicted amidohydrolase